MDSGLRAFVPAQFSSSVTVRNHHYLLALRRNWHRAARGKRMPLIRMSKVISQDVGHRVKPTTFITVGEEDISLPYDLEHSSM
ncbi:hypothetical protein V6N11_013988 [Hibiscus sabdariffa]|uniref:Uncharacterized protein n=1 Tax=Hibiscus sabdariffa TaxID=183260 RepID=A0ABR2AG84_9ROSI